jgi:putative transcriptional regulator
MAPDSSCRQLGNRLRELRARNRLTQAQLAESVGVTRKTINTVENKIFVPSTLLALKIAQALDVEVGDVFYLEPQKELQ